MIPKISRAFRAAAVTLVTTSALFTATLPAKGWDEKGHRMVVELALESLPRELGLPAFLHDEEIIERIVDLSMEPDLTRHAGTRDWFRDAAHYILLDDNGKVAGVDPFGRETRTLGGWQKALNKVGKDAFNVGYLPLEIKSGYEKLVKDFAYWRVMNALANSAETPEKRKTALSKRDMWRDIIIHDLNWLHFSGDAAVPLHASRHINSWGSSYNPHGYTRKEIHWKFEGDAVDRLIDPSDVKKYVTPYKPDAVAVSVEQRLANYILTSRSHVEELYRLEKKGAFDQGGPPQAAEKGRDFIAQRLAAGVIESRWLVAHAWEESYSTAKVGYQPSDKSVRELVANPTRVTPEIMGLPRDFAIVPRAPLSVPQAAGLGLE